MGVNPLGPPTDPATLLKMEAQLLDVYRWFLNASDTDAAAIDGNDGPDAVGGQGLADAAYRYRINISVSRSAARTPNLTLAPTFTDIL